MFNRRAVIAGTREQGTELNTGNGDFIPAYADTYQPTYAYA